MCWALLLQGHMLCKGGIAGILLRKTKEEIPLLLQRQSHFAPHNKDENHNETNHNNSSVTGNLYREPVL